MQEVERFCYIAAHDLKAPLRAIGQLADWIHDDEFEQISSQSRDHLTLLQQRVTRMEGMLDSLLRYSKLATQEFASSPVDVGNLLREHIAGLALSTAKIEVADDMPSVDTFRIPLTVVFEKLIDNALTHANASNVHITCEQSEQWLRFEVSDNGVGIDPKHHERIFDIFHTLEPKDRNGGNGMGLALARRAVMRYGGELTVDSALGSGTRFSFTWPAQEPSL